MSGKVIANIPEIGYYGNEVDYVVNVFNAAFSLTGDEIGRSEIAAYSGMANRFCWMDGDWIASRGCEILGSNNETPFEAQLSLLKSFGWAAKYAAVKRDTDGGQIKRDFIESINKGFPVIVKFGDNNKYGMVIGYEDDGDTLICKEAFDEEGEDGVHRHVKTLTRENWRENILEYILLKGKLEPVSERQRVLALLNRIATSARRTDRIRGKMLIGFAAWEAYLHMLEHEDLSALPLDAPDKDSISLRLGIYCDGLCQIWERHAALDYYRLIGEKYPDWRREIEAAIAALDECSKYAGFLWAQGFAFQGVGLEKFRDPAARKILADEGRKAMQKDMEAIAQFERILERENPMEVKSGLDHAN